MSSGTRNEVRSIALTGFATCAFHKAAVAAAEQLSKAHPEIQVQVNTKDTREAYKAWLKEESAWVGSLGEDATGHTSSPFVVVDGAFLGGHDAMIAWIAKTFPDFDPSPVVELPTVSPIVSAMRFVRDVALMSTIFVLLSVVGRIRFLRRFVKKTALADIERNGQVHSAYDESLLFENAMDKPFAFCVGMFRPMRDKLAGKGDLVVGQMAPNIKLLDAASGKETSLYQYHRGRPLVLNFGSQS
jgi:glutaredoxin